MRTTLAIETEVAERLLEMARSEGLSCKTVLNRTLRTGLRDSEMPEPAFVLTPHHGQLRPGIDDRKVNELAWE